MVRQDGRRTLHFSEGFGALCGLDGTATEDPRAVNCGRCESRAEWKQAWRNEAKRAKAPACPSM